MGDNATILATVTTVLVIIIGALMEFVIRKTDP